MLSGARFDDDVFSLAEIRSIMVSPIALELSPPLNSLDKGVFFGPAELASLLSDQHPSLLPPSECLFFLLPDLGSADEFSDRTVLAVWRMGSFLPFQKI